MVFALLKYGINRRRVPQRELVAPPTLKDSYDVVIIGGGGHGLACAYYLARDHGITDVCVLEKGYIGGGNTGRNTTIIRSNYLTPEGVRFYEQSRRMFAALDRELDINLMYSARGHFTLAHSDSALRTARWRAEINKHLGVESELVSRDDLARMVPQLNLSEDVRYPVLGALYHPPGAIARHDAVAWGYAARASQMGVHIHQQTEVTGITVAGGRVTEIETDRGRIACGRALQATAGHSSTVAALAGLKLPIRTLPLQACVSQPLKPFLDPIIVSGSLHVYISQSARGELVMGGATDPYPLYASRSTLSFKEQLMGHILELFPQLAPVKVLRQWAGLTDITPDFAPIMGATPLENYYIDAGWGTYGFKATPAAGQNMAAAIATGRVPDMIAAFALGRFGAFDLLGERGAAAVGH